MQGSLDLVMIVRDEARCIARCLASARPWVDRMWVLDTGSCDDTAALAAQAGAAVHHFRWIDDFAAARNAALDLSRADWRLVLDADEWIARGAECLVLQRCAAPDHVGQVCVGNQFDAADGSVGESPAWLPRLLPRGVGYHGRIHEQPDTTLPRRRLALELGHDGYRTERLQGKHGRNERLLRMALAEQPHDAYFSYQLGKELELRGDFDAAAPLYLQAHGTGDAAAAWRHDLLLRLVFTLKKAGRFAQALRIAEAEMPRWAHSPDFFFTLGDLLLDWALAEPARGSELLPMIEASWQRALAIGENPALHDSVRGRGSFLAAHNLAALHDSLGRPAQARYWREREQALRGAAMA
jgi:tetratricopeptide (TPR) repeat protein